MGVGGHPVRCAVSTSDQGCQRFHRFNCEPHERLFITAMPPGHQRAPSEGTSLLVAMRVLGLHVGGPGAWR